jgi:3-methyladenine DNA glycosylase AlkD
MSASEDIINTLKSLADPDSVAGMARFGIDTTLAYGVSIPQLRKIAAKHKKNHELAHQLWDSRIHEARILASMVDDPVRVTDQQMDTWAEDFNSWDLCDQCCNNLFRKAPNALDKAAQWSERDEVFVKRAGFVLMACFAVHEKAFDDEVFLNFLTAIKKGSTDDRNFVKKAVNWALRQIGKRSLDLNREAMRVAEEIATLNSKSAKWIASDAIRELTGANVKRRLEVG